MKGFRKDKKQTKADIVKQYSAFVKYFKELEEKKLDLDSLKKLYEEEKPYGMKKEAFIEMSKILIDKAMKEEFDRQTEEFNNRKTEIKKEGE